MCFRTLTIRDRRRLLDADGNQIATLHKALISMHDRSYINLGDSTDQDEAIANVQKVLLSFGHDLQVCAPALRKVTSLILPTILRSFITLIHQCIVSCVAFSGLHEGG